MRDTEPSVYRFGVFELDPRTGELRKQGVRIKLQDQPLQILSLLIRHSGELVTREELQEKLWAPGTYVDYDNAINSAVRKLRDALGDGADNPRFIETLARRGYRFIGTLSVQPQPPPEPEASVPAMVTVRRWRRMIAAGFVVVGLGVLAIWLAQRKHSINYPDIRVTPLITDLGAQIQPSFSPDGTRIAYAWNGPEGNTFGIYVKLIGLGEPVRITDATTTTFSPAWSPDGLRIAALRDAGAQEAIVLMPAAGGRTVELTRLTKKTSLGTGSCLWIPDPSNCGYPPSGSLLAWSSDGKYLFTSGSQTPESPLAIIRVSVEAGEQYAMTAPARGSVGDVGPTLSPDGRACIYFVCQWLGNSGDLPDHFIRGGSAHRLAQTTHIRRHPS
jgi:DNA-binding winged helix-turn-helix (wHTH) protein